VATLAWRSLKDVPPEPILPELRGGARCSITMTGSPEAATRRLAGEIRALTAKELASALEAALREVTTVAALTEAILEVGAVRSVPPGVASRRALEELARDLCDAGFRVRFGPSWTPAPYAEVCVGTGGDLQEFLLMHPSWSVA
jgi:hypothetical protein